MELILKIDDVAGDNTYKDGDIVQAFSNERILLCHAQIKCHVSNFPLDTVTGLRPNDGLLMKFMEKTNKFKFVRVNDSQVKKINLVTLEEEVLEPWGEWLQRVTRQAEHQLERINMETWTQAARRQKWRVVNTITNMNHDRWTKRAAFWDPTTTHTKAKRAEGHPRKRWIDDITEHLQQQDIHTSPWLQSRNTNHWDEIGTDFIYDAQSKKKTRSQT